MTCRCFTSSIRLILAPFALGRAPAVRDPLREVDHEAGGRRRRRGAPVLRTFAAALGTVAGDPAAQSPLRARPTAAARVGRRRSRRRVVDVVRRQVEDVRGQAEGVLAALAPRSSLQDLDLQR